MRAWSAAAGARCCRCCVGCHGAACSACCPVADGTIQATAAGPIVLLRERQTTGGYPRICQLIDCDVDLAAQLRPNEVVHLDLVDVDEAEAAMRSWRACLDALR